jgi:hypothetical protein
MQGMQKGNHAAIVAMRQASVKRCFQADLRMRDSMKGGNCCGDDQEWVNSAIAFALLFTLSFRYTR